MTAPMKYAIILLLLCPLLVSLPSCMSCNKTILEVCDTVSLQVYGIGVTPNMVVVTAYKADNAFDSLVATDTVTPDKVSSDTALLTPMMTYGHNNNSIFLTDIIKAGFILPGFDYKLRILPPDTTFEVTNITTIGNIKQDVTHKAGILASPTPQCLNAILSCKVNGTPTVLNSTDSMQGSLYLIY